MENLAKTAELATARDPELLAGEAIPRITSNLDTQTSIDSPSVAVLAAQKINACERAMATTFENHKLAWEALQHKDNRKLALLDDRVLDLIVSERWYNGPLPESRILH
jgi:hypothetical protein